VPAILDLLHADRAGGAAAAAAAQPPGVQQSPSSGQAAQVHALHQRQRQQGDEQVR